MNAGGFCGGNAQKSVRERAPDVISVLFGLDGARIERVTAVVGYVLSQVPDEAHVGQVAVFSIAPDTWNEIL